MSKAKKTKKSVVSASPAKKRTRNRKPMDREAVGHYVAEIKASLGLPSFDLVLVRLKDDPVVGQDEAIEIASNILDAKVAPSTTRSAAIGRLAKLNSSLVTFKLKQRAVGGRSAA